MTSLTDSIGLSPAQRASLSLSRVEEFEPREDNHILNESNTSFQEGHTIQTLDEDLGQSHLNEESSSDGSASSNESENENQRSTSPLLFRVRGQLNQPARLELPLVQPRQLQLEPLSQHLWEAERRRIMNETLASLNQEFHRSLSLIPTPGSVRIKSSLISYTFLLIPGHKKDSDCSVCLNPSPNFYFCQNHHIFHGDCTVGFIYAKSNYFNSRAHYLRTDQYVRHQYQITSTYQGSSYTVTIPEKNLPQCPECRDTPQHGFFEVEVDDATYGKFSAEVVIPNSKLRTVNHLLSFPLLNKLTAFFTVFQTALAHVQRRPEVSLIVFKAQKFLIISDLIIMFKNYWELCSILSKKSEALYKKRNQPAQENKVFLKILPIVTSVAVLVSSIALTALGIFLVKKSLPKNVNLTEILSKFVSSEEMKNVSAKWDWPIFHTIIQFLYVNRVVSELALVFFSSKPLTHLSYAMLQLFSLYRFSQLKWIKLEKTALQPLFNIAAQDTLGKALSDNFRQCVTEVTTTLRFFVPPYFVRGSTLSFCQNEASHIQSIMKSIYAYSTKLFQNSVWSRDLFHPKRYEIKLQQPLLDNCSCHIKPVLDSIIMKVTSIGWYYGHIKQTFIGFIKPNFFAANFS